MILTETGHHFRRDRDAGGWRCVEHPDLLLLPGARYLVGGMEFDSLEEALLQNGLVEKLAEIRQEARRDITGLVGD